MNRRTMLRSVGAVGSMSALSLPAFAESEGTVVVEQNGSCYRVEPFSYEGMDVEAFYSYYSSSSHTATDLERSDFSYLFFYEDPDGTLSLVALHDQPEDTTGAAATFGFDGLPDGNWIVRDDGGDVYGRTEDCPEGECVDWSWNSRNTDGGVYRLDVAGFDVTITPRFNDEAYRRGAVGRGDGYLRSWCFLSGDAETPRSVHLDMDSPLRIHTGDPSCGTAASPGFDCPAIDATAQPCSETAPNACTTETIEVAVTGGEFDPGSIDADSLRFGDPEAVDYELGASPVSVREADVAPDCEGDGTTDLVAEFPANETGFAGGGECGFREPVAMAEGERDGGGIDGGALGRMVRESGTAARTPDGPGDGASIREHGDGFVRTFRGKLAGETTDGVGFVAYDDVSVRIGESIPVEMDVTPEEFPGVDVIPIPSDSVTVLVAPEGVDGPDGGFDPMEAVDVESLRFGRCDLVARGGGTAPRSARADGDGLLVEFPLEGTGFGADGPGDGSPEEGPIFESLAALAGATTDGQCLGAAAPIGFVSEVGIDVTPTRPADVVDCDGELEKRTAPQVGAGTAPARAPADPPSDPGGAPGSGPGGGGEPPEEGGPSGPGRGSGRTGPSPGRAPLSGDTGTCDIPVAIHGNELIDPVEDLDVGSLRFGTPEALGEGAGAAPLHEGGHPASTTSFAGAVGNLVVHFPAENTGITGDTERVQVVGRTGDGELLVGSTDLN